MRPGTEIAVGPLRIDILERRHESGLLASDRRTDERVDDVSERRHGDGLLEVMVRTLDGSDVAAAIATYGHVPLPPYIRRSTEPLDDERYQTVYARAEGAIAAPTAGLHLTHALLSALERKGCPTASITLHVGLGTFQPVTADDLVESKVATWVDHHRSDVRRR